MKKIDKFIGVIAGSFDPFSLGHLDIVQRSACLVDTLFIAIGKNSSKQAKFSIETRKSMVEQCTLQMDNVGVHVFDCALTDYLQSVHANVLIRGIRSCVDFEYEKTVSAVLKQQLPNLECIYLLAKPSLQHISSSVINELIANNANLKGYLPYEIIQYTGPIRV
ncbi:MAG: pantetheine-phosphate adenylyltransferase [Clostridiales bacterium]|jgi:pantetheine-phosphate adenylyltransferase|nr:pantetheine-phosphate adenylyltransferase [Clostridiales bacterium]